MGQNPVCCTKQTDSKQPINRRQVPRQITTSCPQVILNSQYSPLPEPLCLSLYGEFHFRTDPPKTTLLKLPQSSRLRTRFVWKQVEIWEYPVEKILSLPASVIKQRTFQQKYSWFKLKLDEEKKKYGKGFNKLRVDPTNVLLSSYQNFKDIDFNLQTKVIFTDDKHAIDAGGLFREWVNMSIIQAFSPDTGMFRLCQTDETAYKIVGNKTNKKIFMQIAKILGFVIGKSLMQRIALNCYFNRTIYRILANQPIHLSDMYNFDKQIYNSLNFILNNPINEDDLIPFSMKVKDPFTDKQFDVELKPNGRNQFVNQSNKQDFVQKSIKFYTYVSIKPIIDELRLSLYQVIPYEYLEVFEPNQFEMILCGKQQIDLQDWKRNTSYKGYMPNDSIIIWFWQIVQGFDQTMRSNLLHFCTGSTKVPIHGFKLLECKRGKLKHFNIKCVEFNKDNPYPKGITCFNKLQLPPYQSKQELESMLIAVCQEQIHDFGLDNIQH